MKLLLQTMLIVTGLLIIGQSHCMAERDAPRFLNRIFDTTSLHQIVNPNELLLDALSDKNFIAVHQAIEQGADINCMYHGKFTPLRFAAAAGDYQTVALLLNLGADCNICVPTPLSRAIQSKKQDIVNLLIEFDEKKITPSNKNDSLVYAIIYNNELTVKQLIALGADVNTLLQSDRFRMTYSLLPNKNIIKILLAAGLDNKKFIQNVEECLPGENNTYQDMVKHYIAIIEEVAEEVAFENALLPCKFLLLSLKHVKHELRRQKDIHGEIAKYRAGEDNIKKRMAETKLAKK